MRKYAGFMMLTLLLLIVPALANAWTLTVKVAGGNANNSVTVAYPTSTSFATTATKTIKSGTAYLYPTKAGASVVIAGDDTTPTVTLDGGAYTPEAFALLKSGNHVLQVVFDADGTIGLDLKQLTGGTIYAQNRNNTWRADGVSGLPIDTSVNLTIAADNNWKILGYKVDGGTTVAAPAGKEKVFSFALTAENQEVEPVFARDGKVTASLFAPTDGVAGRDITCTISVMSNEAKEDLDYFVSIDGAAEVPAPNGVYTITNPAAKTYTVKGHVTSTNGGDAYTQVASIVVANAQSAANSGCASCHSAQPVRAHGYQNLVNSCVDCHSDAPHSATVQVPAPHYGGNAFLKAQYVSAASLPISCADCHGEPGTTTANQVIVMQFADSAHGDPAGEAWIHYDWRGANRSACARCHTGTGFVAKLGNENNISNVFQPGDILKPGEALACSACHSDAGAGTLRTAAQEFTINMSNGATVTYDVAGASTLCARCHSGRETGESIKAATDTTGVSVFVDSHYQPAAGTVYNMAGYEYAGQDYDLGSHKLLGANSQGPCVTCHLPGKDHSLVAASCVTCHGVTAPVVNAANLKASYDTALNDLKQALATKGIHYGPVHPFFFTTPYVAGGVNAPFTNWGSVYGASAWKDTMGAAFNYNLLWSEKGAFAHNYGYAMKLIADSIDFLSDGTVDGP